IFSDSGGGVATSNANITLDDAASTLLPASGGIASGTYRPANYGTVQDPFAPPAPAGPYLSPAPGGSETLTSAFTGVTGGNPNGPWGLDIVDAFNLDVGTVSGGWSLTLTNTSFNCSAPINSVTPPAGRASGGQQIVLMGAFAGLSSVTMGGAAASFFY